MRVLVVIPARNEQDAIARCLFSVLAAATPDTRSVVVADGCTDATVDIARSLGVEVLETSARSVGAARRAGIEYALADAEWIANTDADSVVPANWNTAQLDLAAGGTDVVVGTVRPDFADLDERRVRAWLARHVPGQANGHVHGANLGVRTSCYLAAGGFPAVPEHEDVDLVDRLRATGAVVTATAAIDVMTSGRLVGRTPGGYARHLRTDLVTEALA